MRILNVITLDKKFQTKVMLVDDEPENLESLGSALKLNGFPVSGFNNPLRALECFKKEEFDIIITDYQLPGFNGIELLNAMKQVKSGVQVILLTATISDSIIIQALNNGARAFFYKPVNIEELIPLVQRISEEINTQKMRNIELQKLKNWNKEIFEKVIGLKEIIKNLTSL